MIDPLLSPLVLSARALPSCSPLADTSDAAYMALHDVELGRMRRHFARLSALYGWGRRRGGNTAAHGGEGAGSSAGAGSGSNGGAQKKTTHKVSHKKASHKKVSHKKKMSAKKAFSAKALAARKKALRKKVVVPVVAAGPRRSGRAGKVSEKKRLAEIDADDAGTKGGGRTRSGGGAPTPPATGESAHAYGTRKRQKRHA